jgi:tRNA A-37 threonylcarbamoyl transferase component Bud32
MSTQRQCPICAVVLPPGADELCPACLAAEEGRKRAQQKKAPQQEETETYRDPTAPPEVAELAPLFLQLEIYGLLGRGGMAAVYKARQPHLDRPVALKLLTRGTEDPAFAERFAREARTLARLAHPRIVAVHDSGLAGGHCYLLMEYVEGMNLREMVRGGNVMYGPKNRLLPGITAGRMAPEVVRTLADQMCEALEYAHAQGVIHRDIKPENILCSRDGLVKLADFGLAKLVAADAEATRLTAAGHVVGTLRYMAPEQMEKPETVDHRADIYALGVVIYELLTGEAPTGRFRAPSELAPVEPRLDVVILRALDKDPGRRFANVTEFRTALNATPWSRPEPVLTLRRLLLTAGAFTLAWIATCYLWNLGAVGLALAGALFAGCFLVCTRTLVKSRSPELALWKAGPPWHRHLRWLAAAGLGVLGCSLGLFHRPAVGDRAVLDTWNAAYPLNAQEFSARFQGREGNVFPWMGRHYAAALQFKGLPTPAPGEEAQLIMTLQKQGPAPGWGDRVLASSWFFGAMCGLLSGAFSMVLNGWRQRPRIFLWGLGTLIFAALLPYLVVMDVAMQYSAHVNPYGSATFPNRQFSNRVNDVRSVLHAWADSHGYNVVETSTWTLHSALGLRNELGQVAVFHLRRSPLTERWQMRLGRLQRVVPDLLVVCADCDVPRLVSVLVYPASYDQVNNPEGTYDEMVAALEKRFEEQLQPFPPVAPAPLPVPQALAPPVLPLPDGMPPLPGPEAANKK